MNGEKVNNAETQEGMAQRQLTIGEMLSRVASGLMTPGDAEQLVTQHVEAAGEQAYHDGVMGDGKLKVMMMTQLLTGAPLDAQFEVGADAADRIVAVVDVAAVMAETILKRSR